MTAKTTSKETRIKCQRCGKERVYVGSNPYYTTCTFCRTTISIRKNKIESLQSVEVGHQNQIAEVIKPTKELVYDDG